MSFSDYNKKGFFIVFSPPKIETSYEETRCINTACKNNKKEVKDDFKFCPICGAKKDAEIILCNRDFHSELPSDREKFMNHPATKFLLDQLKNNYEIKYGLVSYSA